LRELRFSACKEQARTAAEPLECGEEHIETFSRDHLPAEKEDGLPLLPRRPFGLEEWLEIAVIRDLKELRRWESSAVILFAKVPIAAMPAARFSGAASFS
jgi:hypothetical protein